MAAPKDKTSLHFILKYILQKDDLALKRPTFTAWVKIKMTAFLEGWGQSLRAYHQGCVKVLSPAVQRRVDGESGIDGFQLADQLWSS